MIIKTTLFAITTKRVQAGTVLKVNNAWKQTKCLTLETSLTNI